MAKMIFDWSSIRVSEPSLLIGQPKFVRFEHRARRRFTPKCSAKPSTMRGPPRLRLRTARESPSNARGDLVASNFATVYQFSCRRLVMSLSQYRLRYYIVTCYCCFSLKISTLTLASLATLSPIAAAPLLGVPLAYFHLSELFLMLHIIVQSWNNFDPRFFSLDRVFSDHHYCVIHYEWKWFYFIL